MHRIDEMGNLNHVIKLMSELDGGKTGINGSYHKCAVIGTNSFVEIGISNHQSLFYGFILPKCLFKELPLQFVTGQIFIKFFYISQKNSIFPVLRHYENLRKFLSS